LEDVEMSGCTFCSGKWNKNQCKFLHK
jgi:hypothetical protein